MKLKVKFGNDLVPISKMQEGDIAVTKSWSDDGFLDRIVQRYKDHLIEIGKDFSWINFFRLSPRDLEKCWVKKLKAGDSIEIE